MQRTHFSFKNDGHRIGLIGAIILIITILLSGLTVFNVMKKHEESTLIKSLIVSLDNTIASFEWQIHSALTKADSTSKGLFLQRKLQIIQNGLTTENEITGLHQTALNLLDDQFTRVEIYDHTENKLIDTSDNPRNPALLVQLDTNSNVESFLLWDKQFILRTSNNIYDPNNQNIGRIVTEQPLPILTNFYTETSLVGKTGDFMLCKPVSGHDIDMDCFLRGINGNEFKRVQRIISNDPLPMHFSLNGVKGIRFAKDYRQEYVAAAHSPMAYGLGTVLKIDQEELYQPITAQMHRILLYLGLLIISGILLLHWQISPLVRQLIDSKKDLLQEKIKAERVSSELTAYINAIGKLALISVADRKGKILHANEKFCEISGFKKDELIGQDHQILNSGQHSKSFFKKMWATISKGEIWHKTICNKKKNGTLYWVDSTIVPILNINGKIERYLSVRVDITTHQQRDLELKEQLKESICLQAIRQELTLNLSVEELCSNLLHHIIQSMQFPKIAAAAIDIDNKRFTCNKYQDHVTHKIQTDILANGKCRGQIQVQYLRNKPFLLPLEQNLLDTIANDLGRYLERKTAEQCILEMATHDALTNLPNRRLLQDRIEQVIAHDHRNQTHIAVLFLDLDHFKNINDTLGHDTGDLLLQEVAKRLIACVRNDDTVARQGGDEFIIVIQTSNVLDTGMVAQKILAELSQPFYIEKEELHIGGSIGIAVFPDDGIDAETLMKHSDVAMYHAKKNGRNNFQFFTKSLNKSAHERHSLGIDLRYALERNELILFYQPVVSMPSGKLDSIEVLLRWEHPKHKLISPQKFISLAEETGLIIPIGEWVIKTACEQIKTWQNKGYDLPRLAINLSARQFRDSELVNKIKHTLDETGVAAQSITLEITESTLIDNVEKVVVTLNQLNKMGIQISIDDFGTGYSSLTYLKRFPINTLKIDRSFTQDITTNSSDDAIVAAIIAMAKSLKLNVVAEGIETSEQLNILMQKGCTRYQGYYFNKPLSTVDIEHEIQKRTMPINKKRRIRVIK